MSEKQEVDININITVGQEGITARQESSKPHTENLKINVSLSVAQLAYLLKVLTDTRVIKNKNISELIRFITAHISTPKANDISFDSFKVKFYNPEFSTKQSLHDMLIKQLNHIRKDMKDS